MSSDITLDDDLVILEGKWVKVRAWDLMLDAQDRRQSGTGTRRAMVHDPNDGLTINYNGDYPGGVKIEGQVKIDAIEGKVKIGTIETDAVNLGQYKLSYASATGLHIGDDVAKTYLSGSEVRVQKALTVDGNASFLGEVKVPDIQIHPKKTPATESDPRYQPYSLFQRIKAMQQKIDDLEARIAQLQNR